MVNIPSALKNVQVLSFKSNRRTRWRSLRMGASKVRTIHAFQQEDEQFPAKEVRHYVIHSLGIHWIIVCPSRFLYPGILALIVSSFSYPLGTGQFIAGELSTHDQVSQLFSNFTWSTDELTVEQATIVKNWSTPISDVFVNLTCYTLFTVIIWTYKLGQ